MTQRSEAQAYYFAHLSDVTPECMIWPYSTGSAGYGQVTLNGHHRTVHVLACIAHHGPRPPGMEAAHGPCHDRRCWNGRHLSWKTRAENAADRLRDGTAPRGERNPYAKLTAAAVIAIRSEHAAGHLQREIAVRHGVTQRTVSDVVRRNTWAHVGAAEYAGTSTSGGPHGHG